jgi:hypothetical protein
MRTESPIHETDGQPPADPMHLDRPIAEFAPSLPRILGLGLFLSPFLLCGIAFLVAGLTGRTSFLLPALLELAFAGPMFWFFCVRPLRQRAHLYPTRFVFQTGSREQVVEFDEIVSFYRRIEQHIVYGIQMPPKYFFTIVTEDGRKVKLNSFLANVANLGEAIRLGIFDRLLAQARQQLKAGGSVDFGLVRAEPDGLLCDGERLPWDRVRDMTFYDGCFYIWDTGQRAAWTSGSVGKVANLDVLLALVRLYGNSDAERAR